MLMPNMDGLSFLRQMRADPRFAEVKVIVASNFESMPEAAELHVTKYISKLQCEPEEVASVINQILTPAAPESSAQPQ
jgi:CheY-like chemotaxis protein